MAIEELQLATGILTNASSYVSQTSRPSYQSLDDHLFLYVKVVRIPVGYLVWRPIDNIMVLNNIKIDTFRISCTDKG